jgi:hypothetical protein
MCSRGRVGRWALILLTGVLAGMPTAAGASGEHELFEARAVLESTPAARGLWPGFDPAAIPMAVALGSRTTLLFNHPAPPEGFSPLESREQVFAFPGLHPTVRANSRVVLGGSLAATLMLDDPPGMQVADLAALMTREAFHVFWQARFPETITNDTLLFSYPVEELRNFTARRMETRSLRRAIRALDDPTSASWAAGALTLRDRRSEWLGQEQLGYERALERWGGLARYVENRLREAAGGERKPLPGAFPPQQVWQRAYAVGEMWALLLDRHVEGWKQRLEAEPRTPLDILLREDLLAKQVVLTTFTPGQQQTEARKARKLMEAFTQERDRRLREFRTREGWRLVVESWDEPLRAHLFDPPNLEQLSAGEVLHRGFLVLENQAGSIELLGREALTVAAGEQPLFSGVRRLILTGLEVRPQWTRDQPTGRVRIDAQGLKLDLAGVEVSSGKQILRLTLGKPPDNDAEPPKHVAGSEG